MTVPDSFRQAECKANCNETGFMLVGFKPSFADSAMFDDVVAGMLEFQQDR
jgi:hypothetical protein